MWVHDHICGYVRHAYVCGSESSLVCASGYPVTCALAPNWGLLTTDKAQSRGQVGVNPPSNTAGKWTLCGCEGWQNIKIVLTKGTFAIRQHVHLPMEKFQLYHYSGVASTYVYTQKWSLQYSPLCVEGNESSKLKPLESALNIVHTTEFSAVFPQAQSQKMACLCRGGGSSAPFTILLRGPPTPIHDYWGVLL